MKNSTSQAMILTTIFALLSRPASAADRDPWLGPDKALHFSVSAGLAAGGYGMAALFTREPVVRLGSGFTLSFAAGLAKEMHDRSSGGDPSLRDLTWDAIGAATGVLVAWLVDRFIIK